MPRGARPFEDVTTCSALSCRQACLASFRALPWRRHDLSNSLSLFSSSAPTLVYRITSFRASLLILQGTESIHQIVHHDQ